MLDTHRFQVVLELFYSVSARHLRSEQRHLVHERDESDGGPAADPAATCHQEGATGHGEDSIDVRHVV